MKGSLNKFHWIPRMISILAIIILSLFAFDAFSSSYTIAEQIGRFLVHLSPPAIIGIFLAIAWKRELVGGILFTIVGVVLSPIIYQHNYLMNHSIITAIGSVAIIAFPSIPVGILFIISGLKKKKRCKKNYEY